MRAWMLIESGQVDQGMARMHYALSAFGDTGSRVGPLHWLSPLAKDGLRLIAEALEVVEQSGIRMSEAEIYRTKGTLLLQQSVLDEEQAEVCFHQALDIARQQQARSWELRVVTSLARLWQSQGKRRDAHDLLAPVYGWFTEGFDTADLQDARVLLDVLA
jgi:predicted ATPase